MYEKYLEQLEEAGKIRNLKERSINCYKNYVSYFLKYQGKSPEELTCQDVRTFLLAKKEEGLKATTLNLYNSAIRFFYRNVLHILWDDITVPRMILEHKLPTVLTSDEIDRLLDAVDDIKYKNLVRDIEEVYLTHPDGPYKGSKKELKNDKEYIGNENASAVSLTLPLTKEMYNSKTLFPFFDGLIPEGWMLQVVSRNWKINIQDRFGLLIVSCKDCIGNVSIKEVKE